MSGKTKLVSIVKTGLLGELSAIAPRSLPKMESSVERAKIDSSFKDDGSERDDEGPPERVPAA